MKGLNIFGRVKFEKFHCLEDAFEKGIAKLFDQFVYFRRLRCFEACPFIGGNAVEGQKTNKIGFEAGQLSGVEATIFHVQKIEPQKSIKIRFLRIEIP